MPPDEHLPTPPAPLFTDDPRFADVVLNVVARPGPVTNVVTISPGPRHLCTITVEWQTSEDYGDTLMGHMVHDLEDLMTRTVEKMRNKS